MPTIKENQFFTVLIEWEVDSSEQQAFIDAIADLSRLIWTLLK